MIIVVIAAEFVFIVITTCGSKIENVCLLYARSDEHKYVKPHVVNFMPKIKQQQQQLQLQRQRQRQRM